VAGEGAPLYPPPGLTVPLGAAEWFTGAGGIRLRAALFSAEHPRGTVVLSGGRSEFIEKYLEVIGELVARGYTVLTHDWRGQGLSDRLLPDREKGHADGFDPFAADFGLLLRAFEDRLPAGPRILVSHSMGGCLTALALAKGEVAADGAILTAPMFGIPFEHFWFIRALVGAINALGGAKGYAPRGGRNAFSGMFEDNVLTHDRARFERGQALILDHRDLALGPVTWGWLESAFVAQAWLARSPPLRALAMPFTIIAAGEEKLVDVAAEKRFAGLIPGCRYVEIAQSLHEVMMETDDIRAIFWREFDALALRVSPPN
jgi:lysophospholipase